MRLRVGITTLFVLAAVGNAVTPVGAVESTFTKIVDSFAAVPGGTGFFGTFKGELSRNGEAVFRGSPLGVGAFGVYRGNGGPVSVIVDETTVMPNSLATFDVFFDPVSSREGRTLVQLGANVAIDGRGSLLSGIYEIEDGRFRPLVDFTTRRPEGGLFDDVTTGFGNLTISGANFAFSANEVQESALYLHAGGDLRLLADRRTTIPGRSTPFQGFGELAIEGETAVFGGTITFEVIPIPGWPRPNIRITSGTYKNQGGALTTVVDDTTVVPNSGGERFRFSGGLAAWTAGSSSEGPAMGRLRASTSTTVLTCR